MKKSLIILVLVLMPLPAFSGRVPLARAREVALNFLPATPHTKASESLQLVSEGDELYIFNCPGKGFVIISGDDAAIPVLGYSHSGSFDAGNIPANCANWLEGYREQIRHIRRAGLQQSVQVKRMWDDLAIPTKADGNGYEPQLFLTTANWDQGAPYNADCPEVDGARCLTGCVATAGAIITRFYGYPTKCSGTVPQFAFQYKGKYYDVPAHEFTEAYDWDNMPLNYDRNSTEREKAAVAALMFDIGSMIQASYGPDGTGAYTETLCEKMIRNFGYDSNAKVFYRNSYEDSVWVLMLKGDLNRTGPVLYAGSSENGAHQFLLAGYDTKDNFYVNWGWGGSGNGYYSINALRRNGTDLDFRYNQDAILGMKPAGYDPEDGPVDAATTVDYDPVTGILTVISFRDGECTLTDSAGKIVSNGISKEGRKFIIRSGGYKQDTYVLAVRHGDSVKRIEIVLGR